MARVGFGGGGGSGSAFSVRTLTGGETLAPFDEARVDTGSTTSDVTAPADADSSDGDRIIVGKVDLGAGDVNLLANTGQSIIGPTTVKNQGEALQYVYDGGNSTWRQIGGSTIQRFVDHGANEVTAAVNNQSVDTQSETIGSTRIGPDPNADPQTAINNAPAYSTIEFDQSVTHTISSPIEVTTDGLEIVGLNLQLANATDDVCLFVHGADDVVIRRCVIDGNKANNSQTTNGTVNGITVTNADNCTVRNCDVFDTVSQGVLFTSYTSDSGQPAGDCTNCAAVNNRVDSPGNGGIIFAGGGDSSSNLSFGGYAGYNTVTNVQNEHLQAIDGYTGVSFVGNYIRGVSPGFAIESHTGRNETQQRGFIIVGNYCEADFRGVRIDRNNLRQDGLLIAHNYFYLQGTNSPRGIYMNGSKADFLNVIGNVFEGTSSYSTDAHVGILIEGGAVINNCTIMGNSFYQMNRGVYLNNTDIPATVIGNTVEDVGFGIRFDTAPGARAIGNVGTAPFNVVVRIEAGSATNGNAALGNHGTGTGGTVYTTGSVDNYIVKNNTNDSGSAVNDSAGGSNAIVKDNLGY